MKHESISKATCAESQNVRSSLSRNCVERLTQKTTHTHKVWNDSHLGLIRSPIFQSLPLFIACWFGNTYIWTNFFFSSVWCFFILCQKRIFRVNDTKTWLRLNTTRPNPFGKNQPWRLDICVTDVNFYLLKKLLFCLKHQEMFFTPNNQEINQFQICSGPWIESLKTHLYRVSCTQVFFWLECVNIIIYFRSTLTLYKWVFIASFQWTQQIRKWTVFQIFYLWQNLIWWQCNIIIIFIISKGFFST